MSETSDIKKPRQVFLVKIILLLINRSAKQLITSSCFIGACTILERLSRLMIP